MKLLALILLLLCFAPNVWAEGFGNDSAYSFSTTIGNSIMAVRASPDSSGTLDSMKAYLKVTTEARNVKGAVYLWSDTSFVDSTEIINLGVGESWVYFDFIGNASITASTEYAIAIWSEYSASGDCKLYFALSGGSYAAQSTAAYGVWPTPKWTGVDGTGDYPLSIYAFYTPSEEEEVVMDYIHGAGGAGIVHGVSGASKVHGP